MNAIQQILQLLQDTNAAVASLGQVTQEGYKNEIDRINADAIEKRRKDLERRLISELGITQTDLVQYHVERPETGKYPAIAVAKAISGFQELVTAVFDALRTTPKQRYRPAAESTALSTLDFAMALPVGSVVVSMSVENDRLIAIQSDLDRTFEKVFEILKLNDPDQLRSIASEVGISSIAKAHDWAASAAAYGLNTKITIQKDQETPTQVAISNVQALTLKEAIEEKSDQSSTPEVLVGELKGIDVEKPTYFHLRADDGRNIQGKLSEGFATAQEWAVNHRYFVSLSRVITIRYSTGEEKEEWILMALQTDLPDEDIQTDKLLD